jgi:inhibitor of nuclear factor kappa-B kinase subunit alpha
MTMDQEKRRFLVSKKIELKSNALVKRAFRTKWKNDKAPSTHSINSAVAAFEKLNLNGNTQKKERSVREKKSDTKNALISIFKKDPTVSIRKAASATNSSYGLCQSILRKELMLFPYKYHTVQKLHTGDHEKRVEFANWFLKKPKDTHEWLIATDEAWFTLTEKPNRQNNRHWAMEPPDNDIEVPLHDQKFMVWMAISATKCYGVFVFDETVNKDNYLDMLKNFFWPKHLNTKSYKKYYFLQDGAPSHTSNQVQDWLSSKFGTKFIDKSQWPAHSPDLNPCDFFLWGYLKSRVYMPMPKDLAELKSNLDREVKNLPKDVLKSTFLNFKKRLNLVISANGGHFEKK